MLFGDYPTLLAAVWDRAYPGRQAVQQNEILRGLWEKRKPMIEADKQQLLHTIAQRIVIAEERGLRATAKSWRKTYRVITNRPAAEMVLGNRQPQD